MDLRARLQDYGLSVHKDISELTEDADLAFSFNILEHLEDDVGTLAVLVLATALSAFTTLFCSWYWFT